MNVFGELNISSSRAVSDDEDDELALENEEQLLSKKYLNWFDNDLTKGLINVKQLIIACDAVSSAFVYTYLLNHYESKQLIGIISTNTQFNIELKHLQEDPTRFTKTSNSLNYFNYLYLLTINNQKYLIMQCYDDIKSNEINELASMLVSKIIFDTAVILTSQHRANYYGINLSKIPSIKYLCNEPNFNITWCERLEEPNFITGIPAAIMNICIALKKPALAYVCYRSSIEIDINAVKEFYNVLSTSSHNIYIDNESSKNVLFTLSKKVNSLTGLYT